MHIIIIVSSQQMIVGAARDSRGILIAFSNKQSYGLFFEWMYPSLFKVAQKSGQSPCSACQLMKHACFVGYIAKKNFREFLFGGEAQSS